MTEYTDAGKLLGAAKAAATGGGSGGGGIVSMLKEGEALVKAFTHAIETARNAGLINTPRPAQPPPIEPPYKVIDNPPPRPPAPAPQPSLLDYAIASGMGKLKVGDVYKQLEGMTLAELREALNAIKP